MCCLASHRRHRSDATSPHGPTPITASGVRASSGVRTLLLVLAVIALGLVARAGLAEGGTDRSTGPAGSAVPHAGAASDPGVGAATGSARPEAEVIRRPLPIDHDAATMWRGVRPGVQIASVRTDDHGPWRLQVRYRRTPQQPAGAGTMLGDRIPPNAPLDSIAIELRLACASSQRLLVTLTDAAGVVWSFPTISCTEEPASHLLRLSDLRPDRWQNAGKTIPEKVDPSSLRTMAILDITGFMGAPEVECTWTIESAAVVTSAQAQGEAGTAAQPGPGVELRKVGADRTEGDSAGPAGDGAATSTDGEVRIDRLGRREAHLLFFEALTRTAQRRPEALAALEAIVAQDPRDARSALLLGAGWLWAASDAGTPQDQREPALRRAAEMLDRAVELDPHDDRAPTWQLSARHRLALLAGRRADAERAREALAALAERDPCFHSLAFAIMVWEEPRDAAPFAQAVEFAARAMRCSGPDAVPNGPRWPFGVQGFLLAASDLFAKAGDHGAAEEALMVAEATPGFDEWPSRGEVVDRLATLRERVARFADDDPSNDPPFAMAAISATACVVCHAR